MDAEILAVLIKHTFPPATGWGDSNLQLTTDEIFNRLQDHRPGPDYDGMDIYNILTSLNYLHDHLPGGAIVWLLK